MDSFLDNFILSLSSRDRLAVGDILQAATVGKSDLDSLFSQLTNLVTGNLPVPLQLEDPNGSISSVRFELNFREIFHRLNFMFSTANLISLLLDTHKSLLPAQLKAIEDDLTSIEKLVSNYTFLLAQGLSYSFAFSEDFSDLNGREDISFTPSDRANQIFGPSDSAVINPADGTLTLTSPILNGYNLVPNIINSNATGYISSQGNLTNLLSLNYTSGWEVNVSSPSPITYSLPEVQDSTGAQFVLEFTLGKTAAPASQITLAPFMNGGMELVQVLLFSNDDDSTAVSLLSEKVVINSIYNLYFPTQSVARFRLIVNQPTYIRPATVSNPSEDLYAELHNQISSRIGINNFNQTNTEPERLRVQQLIRLFQVLRKFNQHLPLVGVPYSSFEAKDGSLSLDNYLKILNTNDWVSHWDSNRWDTVSSVIEDIFRWAVKDRMDLDQRQLFTGGDQSSSTNVFRDIYGPDAILVRPQPIQSVLNPNPNNSSQSYDYRLGFYFVGIGIGTLALKGAFISKPLPCPQSIGKIQIKSNERHYVLPDSDRDSSILTSVEYSVSNVASPDTEDNWIPILSSGVSQVMAERFFPDATGRGFFRFPVHPQFPVKIYKNGFLQSFTDPNYLIYDGGKQNILGLALPIGGYSVSDIFTCDYTPAGDPTTVDFNALSSSNIPLVSAYDAQGAGQGFVSTNANNTITLTYVPYVDYGQVASSTYNPQVGMTPYQPISIVMEDGKAAVNLTNYSGGVQAGLETALASSFFYTYVQSGQNILFNRKVVIPFRVFYQYLQNDVRIRVVLRSNDKSYVTPVVSAFQAKAITQKSDLKSQ